MKVFDDYAYYYNAFYGDKDYAGEVAMAASLLRKYEQNTRRGIFLFDAWYGPGVLSEKPVVRVKTVQDEHNTLIRYARPVCHEEADTVDVVHDVLVVDKKTSEARHINETHKMRYFFRPGVELMLDMADMDLLDCVDCKTLRSTTFDSWTAYFVARPKE